MGHAYLHVLKETLLPPSLVPRRTRRLTGTFLIHEKVSQISALLKLVSKLFRKRESVEFTHMTAWVVEMTGVGPNQSWSR